MNGIILGGLIATGILFAIAIGGWILETVDKAQKLLDGRD